MATQPLAPTSAIILGGGRSSRMGTDKLGLHLGGRSLLQRACDAVAPHASRVVVAGPERAEVTGPTVEFVVEDPPFGGPVAGIVAALGSMPGEGRCFLLAGDLAAPDEVVATLLAHATQLDASDAVVLEDADGWPQFLAGLYRTAALRDAAARLESVRDASVRRLLGGLALARVPAPARTLADIDTPEDAERRGATPPGASDEDGSGDK